MESFEVLAGISILGGILILRYFAFHMRPSHSCVKHIDVSDEVFAPFGPALSNYGLIIYPQKGLRFKL